MLVRLVQSDSPILMTSVDGGKETLHTVEYMSTFSPCIDLKPSGFVNEASRETSMVAINSLALVETLMGTVSYSTALNESTGANVSTRLLKLLQLALSSGIGRTRHGALQLIEAEFQVLSPLVPVNQVKFLRFCKQHGVLAVVDVSVDTDLDGTSSNSFVNCRRLPCAGFVQDLSIGYSRGFGALRWLSTLQRQCDYIAILLSSTLPCDDHPGLTPAGRRILLQLTNHMRGNFCSAVCSSTAQMWHRLHVAGFGDNVKAMIQRVQTRMVSLLE